MRRNKGISLIVLVITIIVMIILAGSIILSLSNNGIIGKANEAVERTDINQVQTLAELKWAEAYLRGETKLWQLKEAVREGLTEENIDISQYDIQITTKGTSVSEKVDTKIISGEISGTEKVKDKNGQLQEGENEIFKYVKLANGDIQISNYMGDLTELVIPAKYDGYNVYSIGNVASDVHGAGKQYSIFDSTNSTVKEKIESVTISQGVKKIGTFAFNGCSTLISVTLPNSLEVIGAYAFKDSAITGDANGYLEIPEGIMMLGDGAFRGCTGLRKIKLPNTLETIGKYTFMNCTNLTDTLVIPEGIKEICSYTFNNCGLTGIRLPSTLIKIDDSAFKNCSQLEGEIYLAGIQYVTNAFDGTKVTIID